MKNILIILLLSLFYSSDLVGQNKSQDSLRIEVARLKLKNEHLEKRINDFEQNQKTVLEIKNELADANFNMANSKQALYDSQLNKLNLIFTAIGIIIAVLGFLGYRSISGRLNDIKTQVDKEIESLEKRREELKQDINKRVDDIKLELREFKKEQKEEYNKFERSANERIKDGLDLQLENAIDKIMKGSLGVQINSLNEQVAELFTSIEQLKSDNAKFGSTDVESNNDISSGTVTGTKHQNAFENEAK
jgi:hypothetical protein